jgi:hypothetical protein
MADSAVGMTLAQRHQKARSVAGWPDGSVAQLWRAIAWTVGQEMGN